MSQVITTGNHPKAMWPGIKAWWTTGQEHAPLYPELFEMDTSDKAYEELVEDYGFNLIAVKPQADSITYQVDGQGPTTRVTHVAYAGGYMVSHEEMVDDRYPEVSKRRTAKLARAARATHETVAANVYNNAFSSSFLGADGVALISASHPTPTGNQSNAPTAADMSEAAIEDAITLIMKMTDAMSLKEDLKAMSLHYPPDLWAEANRIVKSILQNDSAQNAVNVIKLTGQFPNGLKPNTYFTDSDAWFIRTDEPDSLVHYQREPLSSDEDGAFDNKVQKYACYERWAAKWGNWRGLVASQGV